MKGKRFQKQENKLLIVLFYGKMNPGRGKLPF